MKTYTFYLLRHGKAVSEPMILGSTDRPLTDVGISQAQECRKAFEQHPVEAVFSSSLTRALMTAQIVFPQQNALVLDGLREYGFGSFEGKRFTEVMPEKNGTDAPFSLEALLRFTAAGAPDAENRKAYLDRIFDAFCKILEGCMKANIRTAAIVSHGCTISTLMAAFSYPKFPSIDGWHCPNCGGFVVKTDPALWMRDRVVETAGRLELGKIEDFVY